MAENDAAELARLRAEQQGLLARQAKGEQHLEGQLDMLAWRIRELDPVGAMNTPSGDMWVSVTTLEALSSEEWNASIPLKPTSEHLEDTFVVRDPKGDILAKFGNPFSEDRYRLATPDEVARIKGVIAASESTRPVPGDREATSEEIARPVRGCLPPVLIGVVLVVIAGLVGRNLLSDDDEQATPAAVPPAASPSATAGACDPAAVAGTWILASGLDDPSGIYVATQFIPDNNRIGPSSASVTIAEDCTITGGSYHTSKVHTNPGENDPACQQTTSTTDGDSATGSVGADGKSDMRFMVRAVDVNQCGNSPAPGAPSPMARNFWITGDTMVMCPGVVESPTTCLGGYAPGLFRRT